MRILHALEPADGGVARHVRDLVAGQVARGHSVQAIVSDRGPLADDLRRTGAGVVALDLRPEITAFGPDARAVLALSRMLRPEAWDIVHTHGNKAGTLVRPLAAARGLAVVHTPHSFAYASQRHRPRRGQEARRALTLAIERACSRFSRVIICVSEAERSEAIRDGVAPPGRLVTVPNGIAPPPWAEPDPRLGADSTGGQPLIGFLARLHEQKAPLLLLSALELLRERDLGFRAALVGDGPLSGEVREQVVARGLADFATVLAFPEDVWAVLAAFDIYVLPSLWESMPIGLLEAMAMGLPVVAADTGGVREVVVEGETGLLHPVGDADALAGALERLLCDPELRTGMGAAGQARQTAEYSLEAMVDGVSRAYGRALTS